MAGGRATGERGREPPRAHKPGSQPDGPVSERRFGMKYKLFVFDLDETLWSVSEGLCSLVLPPFTRPHPDRVENDKGYFVELKPGVRKLFEFLRSKGCYISLASRNDAEPTLRLLEALELLDFLDFPQLSWKPKEESIEKIIKAIQKRDKLTIKPGEVFFLDDWAENVVPVKKWGATSLVYGQDIESYDELIDILRR